MIRETRASGAATCSSPSSAQGIDTRTVWTGNATRQPMMRKMSYRQPPGGLPNADAVMERGMLVPMGHGLSEDDVEWVCGHIEAFLESR